MLKKNSEGIYQSSLLLTISGLKHGFSNRMLGDMRQPQARRNFLHLLRLGQQLTLPEQIHGNKVRKISTANRGKKLAGVDGLVSKVSESALGIRAADCVPILAVDPVSKVIGAAHAGWRGTLGNIAGNLIKSMVSEGAKLKEIRVSIGPHIGMCCYDIPIDRAEKFLRTFNNDPGVAVQINGIWHLALGYANYRQLLDLGVLPDYIDAPVSCTSCQINEFYSYRRDNHETFGEILGVISLINFI